ncbi:MAG: hypothetical protein KC620_08970 [Myxococcales bacterium]|nr:hypothetical protein [Myxococcales bacterium]
MPLADLDALRPAPRSVPLTLALRLRFGDATGIIGWSFMAMGSLFTVVFLVLANPTEAIRLAGETARTEGRMLGWEETSASVNEAAVVANHFVYTVDGIEREGVSYGVGVGYATDEVVPVEYAVEHPESARIPGMQTGLMPLWPVALVGLFPLIGLMFATHRFFSGGSTIALLRAGRPARGKVVGTATTGVRINNRPQYAVTFTFTDHLDAEHEVKVRTLDLQALLDEPEEALLYDPNRPTRAVALDQLPGIIAVDRMGGWRPAPLGSVIGTMVPVTLTLLIAGTAARYIFGG